MESKVSKASISECPSSECIITLKTSFGRYVAIKTNEKVTAGRQITDENAQWYIFFKEGNIVNLKNKETSNYLFVEKDGAIGQQSSIIPDARSDFTLEDIGGGDYALISFFGNHLTYDDTSLSGFGKGSGKDYKFQINVCK